MKVLIVDDDAAALHLTTSVVRAGGHEVVVAHDGVEALEVGRLERPDLLLTDILMPKMDGYQLAREWKADQDLSPVPVVFLTASYTDPADVRFALDLGAERFLTKPVEPDLLLQVLAEIGQTCAGDVRPPRIGEEEMLREYSERLVHKLEQKVLELQQSNTMLERTMDALSRELEVKTSLIDELGDRLGESGRDVERMHAQAVLATAIDGADVFAFVVDRDGVVTYMGRGAERATGYSSTEVLGRDWLEVMAPAEERDRRRAAFVAIVLGGQPVTCREEIVTARGERVMCDWWDFPWRDAHGDVAGVLAFGHRAV